MDPEIHSSFDAHEHVSFFVDPESGLSVIIAIHSTALGPAAGGCRVKPYFDTAEALGDALRLSQGMSYKNAMANLPVGGGKAVILGPLDPDKRAEAFRAFGDAVEGLGGRYITAEDVGTSVSDMLSVNGRTRYVSGLPGTAGQAGGDPSPWTALGVFQSIEMALGRSVRGSRVAVQGIGNVGWELSRLLHEAGAKLIVADVDGARAMRAHRAFDAEIEGVESIHRVASDVFSPCALGAGLNGKSIAELGAPLVCGAANNQLASAQDGWRLAERSITYVPDYIANAGGIISVVAEYFGETRSAVKNRVQAIAGRVHDILQASRADHLPANLVADQMAQNRIRHASRVSA